MTNPQVLASAQKDLETIISDMRDALNSWAHGLIDDDEYGEKITDAIYDLDDYRKAYAPTDRERFLQGRDHAEELSRDVFRDEQENDR